MCQYCKCQCQNWRTLLSTAATAGGRRAALKRETLEWCFPNVRVIVTVLYRDPGASNQRIKLIMFTRLRQPSWSTAVAGWSSIRILSPSQWGWSCSLGWCPAQQPAPSLPSHATPDTARNSRHQWPHGSGQCCSLSLISWRFSLSQLLQGSLKRLYECQLGSNDVPVTVCRSGAWAEHRALRYWRCQMR